ncbi:hypothetical protein [Pseudomonas sp. EL_65y_Pfl2_R96]|uniref:hypothetical protein n=1 Tax=Pseudomonas sp. EL_65y_Pfl2_R96 TaxID=3088699 RepID=UPI0030D82A4F
MKDTKTLLAITSLSLAIFYLAGCSSYPISAAQAYAAANEPDPANKTVATDLRNKMAARAR